MSESMRTGHLFFDNNTIGFIRDNRLEAAVVANARAASLEVLATELNLVEAYSAPKPVADAVVQTLRAITGRPEVLPWTGGLLKATGEAFLTGSDPFRLPLVELEAATDPVERERLRADLLAFKQRIDRSHKEIHERARPLVQRKLKERGVRAEWSELPAFLETWPNLDTARDFARRTWTDCDLPGEFPPEILVRNDTWRLASDADALGLFQAALVFEQPRQVQRMDQLQLPYLGGSDVRILVTRDAAFAEAARMVLERRYPLARVMSAKDFFG